MALSLRRCRWRHSSPPPALSVSSPLRYLRSEAALEAIAKASADETPTIALYNYPSFSGAFSALFANLFHSRLNLPCLILPFSSVIPLRMEDLCLDGLKKCYFLDFIGPKGFAMELSRRMACEVVCFDHRSSVLKEILSPKDCTGKVTLNFDTEKSSARAVYQYFSNEFAHIKSMDGNDVDGTLLNPKDRDRVETILNYIEDGDLRKWKLPDAREFRIGINEWRSNLSCLANPHMFEQLLQMSHKDLIAKGRSCLISRKDAAKSLLVKVFKLRLGKGFFGECLGIRADGNSDLANEIGKELSLRSAAAGLRPIGAIIYFQRNNLKMCLRSTDSSTDTSEVAKAYGGGGSPSSSSFIISMNEYNQWLSINSPT